MQNPWLLRSLIKTGFAEKKVRPKFPLFELAATFDLTLESGIDVGQLINVGPGKFVKKNKRRALNAHFLCSK